MPPRFRSSMGRGSRYYVAPWGPESASNVEIFVQAASPFTLVASETHEHTRNSDLPEHAGL